MAFGWNQLVNSKHLFGNGFQSITLASSGFVESIWILLWGRLKKSWNNFDSAWSLHDWNLLLYTISICLHFQTNDFRVYSKLSTPKQSCIIVKWPFRWKWAHWTRTPHSNFAWSTTLSCWKWLGSYGGELGDLHAHI